MLLVKIKNILTNGDNRELLVTSIIAVVIRIFGALSAFLATFFIARHLGATESGNYFLVYSVVAIISAFSNVGLNNTVLRFVSGSPELAISVVLKSIILIFTFGLICAVTLHVLSAFIASAIFSKPEIERIFKYMSFGVIGLSGLTISAMALQGVRQISASIFILNIACNIFLVACLYFFSDDIFAAQLGGVFAASSIAVGIFGFILFYIYRPRVAQSEISWRMLLASCAPLWVVVIMSQMVQWSGQFMAGVYVSSELVAQLAVAQRTAMLTSFVLIAVNLVVAPRFASLYKRSDLKALESLAIKSVKLVGVFAMPLIVGMIIFPEFLMGFFGDEFVEGANLLRILAIGQFVNAITGSVSYLLIMSGHEKDLRNATLVSGLVAITLTWLLTLHFGVIGAAISTAVAVAGQNLLAVYFVKKRLGFNTLAVWR